MIRKAIKSVMGILPKLTSVSGYSTQLENYILSKNPQNTADLERLEREFNHKVMRRSF